jgi:hypothetical protein
MVSVTDYSVSRCWWAITGFRPVPSMEPSKRVVVLRKRETGTYVFKEYSWGIKALNRVKCM